MEDGASGDAVGLLIRSGVLRRRFNSCFFRVSNQYGVTVARQSPKLSGLGSNPGAGVWLIHVGVTRALLAASKVIVTSRGAGSAEPSLTAGTSQPARN